MTTLPSGVCKLTGIEFRIYFKIFEKNTTFNKHPVVRVHLAYFYGVSIINKELPVLIQKVAEKNIKCKKK